MLKAVIFDMDGVLVDTETLHYKINKELLEKYGCKLDMEYYKQFIGSTNTYMWEKITKDYTLKKKPEDMLKEAACMKAEYIKKEGFPKIPGVNEMLCRLKKNGYKLAIASSSSPEYILEAMESIGVRDFFDAVVSGETVENPKPAPDIFLEAAKKLFVLPSMCIVIEDSTNGVSAALAANMPVIGFSGNSFIAQNLTGAEFILCGYDEFDGNMAELAYARGHNEPWTPIETKRLYLREFTTDDLDSIYRIYDDETVGKYLPKLNNDRKIELGLLVSYIKNFYRFYNYGFWAVVEKETGEVIGKAGINNVETKKGVKLEIGYIIRKDKRRNGYAYEACCAINEYAKKSLEAELICRTKRENVAAVRLAEKIGIPIEYLA